MTKALVLLSLSALLLLPSCGDKEQQHNWKHNDNTLRVRQPSEARTMNPYLFTNRYETQILKLMFQAPMEFEHTKLDMTPVLIKSQPIIENITEGPLAGGQKFTYEILDEATWDDGKPVTGNDFLFSMKVVFNPKLPTQRITGYFDNVADVVVDAANPKKFTVTTTNSYILSKAGISNFVIIPEHIYDPNGLLKSFSFGEMRNPANAKKLAEDQKIVQYAEAFSSPAFGKETVSGSGPYKLVEWQEGQRVVLAKKQNWWGEKLAAQNSHLAAHSDTIIFFPVPDQAATIAALKDESLDVSGELDAQQFTDLRANDFVAPILDFYTPPTFTYFMTLLNNQNPKLSDKRVRRALAHAVDMEAVINDLYNGLATRMIGPVFPEKSYFDKSLAPIPFDLEKARTLLKEAGWEDSNGNGTVDKTIDGSLVEMKLTYQYTPTSSFQNSFTELFKGNAQKIGVEIERVPLEFKVSQQNNANGTYELGLRAVSWAPLPDDFKQLWHTDGIGAVGGNNPRFGNAETDALIDAIRNNTNDAERNEQCIRLQKIIYDEQPVIFQLIPLDKVAVHKRFEPALSQYGPSYQHFKLREME